MNPCQKECEANHPGMPFKCRLPEGHDGSHIDTINNVMWKNEPYDLMKTREREFKQNTEPKERRWFY